MAYSYDDFVSAANAAGMMGNFNQQDLETARRNPEFGLSMLSLMQDGANATTDEQRVLASEAANQLRRTYGNYTIGEDGAAQYAGSFGQQIQDTMGQIENYGDYSYKNQEAYQQLLDAVINPEPFSYDPESDPVFGSYKKAYLREGNRATAQALAQASAASGGRPSSHAVTAANQAGNYYVGQLADIIPTLFQNAYDRHVNDLSMKLSGLGAMNTDREFDYGAWLDGYTRLQSQLGNLQTQDGIDYSRYLDAWNMAYQREQDDLEKQQAAAELMAKTGDYTLLGQLLGLTPEQIAKLNGETVESGPAPGNPGGDEGYWYDTPTKNEIKNMQYTLGVTPTGVWDAETVKASGYADPAAAREAWNTGKMSAAASVNKQIQSANTAIRQFKPTDYSPDKLRAQIEAYAAALYKQDPMVGEEVGAALLNKYGL